LPDYDSCAAIALSLLPYFEKHPELWKILPHVQDVDPLANWREFFSHMLDTADDSCRGPLKEMIDHLFP
ncbi:MAG: hypothetical protein K2H76_09245, partial [Muribaculaceae bacterium]|nr:hypothetical protein [Muribaculaceae bacterium]